MKVFVIFLILIGFTGIAFAESNTGESVLAISTPFNSYVSGDKVYVYIDTNPNSNVTINVTDPSSNTVEEILATSDEDGRIFTSFFLPVYSELGTWIMNATYDVNFDTTEFEVVRQQKDRMVNDILTLEKYSPIREPFAYSDHVLVGTILQKENVTENTLNYSIDVDFYLKNEQSFDFLTATFVPMEKTYYDIVAAKSVQQINSPFYFEGDVVFVYLKNNDGKYEILPQSFVIDKSFRHGIPRIVNMEPIKENFQLGDTIIFSGIVQKTELYQAAKKDKPFDITLTIHDNAGTEIVSESLKLDSDATYEYELPTTDLPVGKYEYEIDFRGGNGGSLLTREITLNPSHDYAKPLKQIESGVSVNEIQCKPNLVLVQKYDGSPACVTESTKQKLIERGWTTQSQNKIEYQVLSKDKILSKGTGFDLPKDTFTEDDLRELEQHEKELRKTLATKDLSYEEREKIVNEINSMQERIHHPFQTGVPYHLVKMIQERYGTLEANYSKLEDVYFSVSGPNQISHLHQALRIGIHPDHFSLPELKQQDKTIREYLGDEMNILYEKVLVVPSDEN